MNQFICKIPEPKIKRYIQLSLALFLLLGFTSAWPGQLEVRNDNATIGNNGLRVTAGATCSVNNVTVTGPTVSTDQLACDNITTSGNVQVSGSVTFTAGDLITLASGFSVPTGASFNALVSSFVDSPYAFVLSNRANDESSYNARFDLNVDSFNLAVGEDIRHFVGRSANGTEQFRLILRNPGSGIQLVLAARSGGSLVEHGTPVNLAAGFNNIFVEWRAGNGDGRFQVTVNGAGPQGPTTLFNNAERIDQVRWGLVGGPAISTSTGFIDQDDFFSFR